MSGWNLGAALAVEYFDFRIVQVEFCTKCRNVAILVQCGDDVINGGQYNCAGFLTLYSVAEERIHRTVKYDNVYTVIDPYQPSI